MTTEPLLLDTCAAIWFATNDPISGDAVERLAESRALRASVYISAITAWEIGLLIARRRLITSMTPESLFDTLIGVAGVLLAELSPRILIASSFLPGDPPRDPADRIIAATARERGLCVVTRDRQLLEYAAAGYVNALAC
jgi:PIN domain nuclease of toxin-antitoxin system